jgi:predicted Holliday junction resolvase-like endonuclease
LEIILYIFAAICCVLVLCFFKNKRTIPDISALIERERESRLFYENKVESLQENIINLENAQQTLIIERNGLKHANSILEQESNNKIKLLSCQLDSVSEEKKKITSQKKSSEVRLGHIAETLAPFLDQFEFDPETCVFLGKPIDYISFADDEITFIEVKSGKSQLNSRQRYIRDQVKGKLVNWKEIRIE